MQGWESVPWVILNTRAGRVRCGCYSPRRIEPLMPKRTLAVFAAAAFGALALPFGLPTIAHATGPSYNSISIKPLPLEQPGMLSPTGTNTVTACVQPLSDLHVVPGATVYLSIDAGLFTAPVEPGGSAIANGSTTLTATPQPIVVPTNTCDWSNI